MQAISKYFGKKNGQSMTDFMSEMKNLSTDDKQELGDLCRAELALSE